MSFGWHPVILALILLLSVLTVLISAWLPAGKLSRLTPLEAIRGTGELQLKRKRNSRILSAMFGVEGELAGNALKAQKKALRTTSLSLTLAFLGFMLMQCFWTLSGISTNHTYFEKYQDVWDVMVTVKDTSIEDFVLTEELRGLPGADSSVVYQKAEAMCILPREAQSQELLALGGLEALAGMSAVTADSAFPGNAALSGNYQIPCEDVFLIQASIIILDDESFGEYCRQTGIAPRLDGTIVLNRLWDSQNSNFRYPEYIPYVKEDMGTVILSNVSAKGGMVSENTASGTMTSETMTEFPVLACTQEYPLLREEYGKSDHSLVQFIPLSLWKEIEGQTGGAGQDTYIRILADDRGSLDALTVLEEEAARIVGQKYDMESENRIQERIDNDKMIEGYELILGAFCVLLAIIGIAHVFSNTLGFLRQRKREFARLLSVGLTTQGLRKMFCIEALVIAGRPALITFTLTIVAVAFMIKASYLDPAEFIRVAPVVPILAFILAVLAFVAFAYYLGGRKVLKVSLAEALRDDTVM